MIPAATNDPGHPWTSIQTERGGLGPEDQLEKAIALRQRLENLRGWGVRLSARSRRICSSGQLLFQVVGIAGFAGYFVAMHWLMRLFSGVLMGATWYGIYKIKGPH